MEVEAVSTFPTKLSASGPRNLGPGLPSTPARRILGTAHRACLESTPFIAISLRMGELGKMTRGLLPHHG